MKKCNFRDGRTTKKYYCKDCGKRISIKSGVYGNKRCKSCCQLGKLNCRYGIKMNIKERQHLSKLFSGKNNPMFGKLTHSKKSLYKGIWMRSSWEMKYAKYLDKKRIKWLYEPKTFELGNVTYTPDFYLPEKNLYIEIKGYWRDKSKNRFQLFKEYYPELKILLMQRNDLTKLKILK